MIRKPQAPTSNSYTFAIADLHGMYEHAVMALEAIAQYQPQTGSQTPTRPKTPGTSQALKQRSLRPTPIDRHVVVLGDFIDRGPHSADIVALLMQEEQKYRRQSGPVEQRFASFHVIVGNHEEMLLGAPYNDEILECWLNNGGNTTLLSYGHQPNSHANCRIIPDKHRKWLASLPFYVSDKHRLYVHAGVHPSLPLERQNQEVMQWKIYEDDDEQGHIAADGQARHVVHGHHMHEDGPRQLANRTGLDTGCFMTKRLVIGIFDDATAGGPIDFIEITG